MTKTVTLKREVEALHKWVDEAVDHVNKLEREIEALRNDLRDVYDQLLRKYNQPLAVCWIDIPERLRWYQIKAAIKQREEERDRARKTLAIARKIQKAFTEEG